MSKRVKGRLVHRLRIIVPIVVVLIIIAVFVVAMHGTQIPVLNPQGIIADQERNLILITLGLGLLVVVPVFIMLFSIAWKYRATNTKATYQPEYDGNRLLEGVWWGIPCVIIIILAVITGYSTHALDPYKPIDSSVKPINVQVIALQWKWLFVYPDQGVASVGYLNIPEKTPINFTITSDAPMNSFWIPSLAGQIYAMSGMSTQLHIMADTTGKYNGSSANISGDGFAGMTFKVNSLSNDDFKGWAKNATTSDHLLTADAYKTLAQPSLHNPETTYTLVDQQLYNEVIMKYMMPSDTSEGSL